MRSAKQALFFFFWRSPRGSRGNINTFSMVCQVYSVAMCRVPKYRRHYMSMVCESQLTPMEPPALHPPPPCLLMYVTNLSWEKAWDSISQEVLSNFLAICNTGKSSLQSVCHSDTNASHRILTLNKQTSCWAELSTFPEQHQGCDCSGNACGLHLIISYPYRRWIQWAPLTTHHIHPPSSAACLTISQVMNMSRDE